MEKPGDSDPHQGLSPEAYAAHLRSLMTDLQSQTQQITTHEIARRRIWDTITRLTRENGVPEEAKFEFAALHHQPTNPQETAEYIDKLKALDEETKASAGQLVAWLTSEVEQTSHPFNPSVRPETEDRYYFHIGLLPQDARLAVNVGGKLSIPVERSAAFPLIGVYLRTEPLSFEGDLYPINSFGRDIVQYESDPGINISLWDKRSPYPLLIGDQTVKEKLKEGQEARPEIEKALDLLTASLF